MVVLISIHDIVYCFDITTHKSHCDYLYRCSEYYVCLHLLVRIGKKFKISKFLSAIIIYYILCDNDTKIKIKTSIKVAIIKQQKINEITGGVEEVKNIKTDKQKKHI